MGLMGAEIGDQVVLPLDFSSYLGDKAAQKLFAIMVAQIDDAYVDFSKNMLIFVESDMPLEMFGLSTDTGKVDLMYNVTAEYEKPGGKFSIVFSNSAIIDCHYLFDSFLAALSVNLIRYKDMYPDLYEKAVVALEDIE